MMTSLNAALLFIALAGSSAVSAAQEARSRDPAQLFSDLRSEVAELRQRGGGEKSAFPAQPANGLVECLPDVEGKSSGQFVQYIYNQLYRWSIVPVGSRYCVFLWHPLNRSLSPDEARDLLDASRMEFPVHPSKSVSPTNKPLMLPGGATPKISFPHDYNPDAPAGTNSDVLDQSGPQASGRIQVPDQRVALSSSQFPYNAVSLVLFDQVNGSAVQVTPYVFMTAAHVVVNKETKVHYTGGIVYPSYGMPAPTAGLEIADLSYIPAYFPGGNEAQRTAHDVGFIRIASARPLPIYPPIYVINSARDVAASRLDLCPYGNPATDPFVLGAPAASWFNGFHWPACDYLLAGNVITETVGYPDSVRGASNTNPTRAYRDSLGFIAGSRTENYLYELFHYCPACTPFTGLASKVSSGDSGGAVFGAAYNGSYFQYVLLGIISSEVVSAPTGMPELSALAAGSFDYNQTYVTSELIWTPALLIDISAPIDGGSYNFNAIPNFRASAGSLTDSIRWSSDIDGYLGTGGDISVAGRLSIGSHTITASIETTGVSGDAIRRDIDPASVPVKTVHIIVGGTPPVPTFEISPTVVLIPATEVQGEFTYEWNAPGYTSLDLQNSTNGANWAPVPPLNVPSSFSVTQSIEVGTTYRFRFLPHGDSSTVLGTLEVKGVRAPLPVFVANPEHITTNGASGNTTLSWNAPGYSGIDWCGSVNDGDWGCGSLTTPAVGSTVVPVPVGTKYGYRFYPSGSPNQGGTFNLLGELFVDAMAIGSVSFMAHPTHVVVPSGGTFGNTILTWNAPGYLGLDWCGKVNGGPWTWGGLSTDAAGKVTVPVPVGTTYGYRIYAPGQAASCSASTMLADLTVEASH